MLNEKYVELMGLSNCYLEISKILIFSKILEILKTLKFSKNFQEIFKKFKKPEYMLNNYVWWTTVQNFMSISSKMTEVQHFACRKHALFALFLLFSIIFDFFNFWPILMIQKVFDPKFLVWPFWPHDLGWPWPEIAQDGTTKCSRPYLCQLVGFVCV